MFFYFSFLLANSFKWVRNIIIKIRRHVPGSVLFFDTFHFKFSFSLFASAGPAIFGAETPSHAEANTNRGGLRRRKELFHAETQSRRGGRQDGQDKQDGRGGNGDWKGQRPGLTPAQGNALGSATANLPRAESPT